MQNQLEEEIFRVESQYLEDTTAGNIIKGFDTYIKGSSATGGGTGTGGGTSTRRKGGITEQDRIFSRSSASFTRVSPPEESRSPCHRETQLTDSGRSGIFTAVKCTNDAFPCSDSDSYPNAPGQQPDSNDGDNTEGRAKEREQEGAG